MIGITENTVEIFSITLAEFYSKFEGPDTYEHLFYYGLAVLGLVLYWYFFQKPFNLFKVIQFYTQVFMLYHMCNRNACMQLKGA